MMPSSHLTPCRPLFLLPSIFTVSGSFLVSQLFVSGGQSIGALASASVLPLGLTGLTSLLFTGAAYTLRKTML